MTRSSNSFSASSFTASSNTFSNTSFTSVTSGIRKVVQNASLNGWSGDNITSDYFAQYGDFEGSYFGQGSFGGIRHFNK